MKTATSCGRKNGFSLVELPVILGVVALLAILMVKAAAHRAKDANQNAQCLANTRQLTAAWLMYAGDYNDRCCNNYGINPISWEVSAHTYQTWGLNLVNWSTSSDNTNVTLLQHGSLNAYVGGSAAAFRCPEDNYLAPQQQAAKFQARVRSYTMNGHFGHYSGCLTCAGGNTNTGTDNTYLGGNEFNMPYRQFLTVGAAPKPQQFFLFIDEAPDFNTSPYFDSGNAPTTWTATTPGTFASLPASYHNGGAGVSFADGHAEIHRWVDKTVLGTGPIQSGAAGIIRPVTYGTPTSIPDTSPYTDIHWMWSHEGTPF
ncbi:MAG TPA: H-X9-DG-CTERM domain-containing protein [Verrucomicrobiae bacterium]|jgi:prepilin-type processing-associated H-X9-DG protein|nr:H-X9-DG-CTERM domain-containing protein [Verrucomicrobiae bacterium]